jgi:hypothetical protein
MVSTTLPGRRYQSGGDHMLKIEAPGSPSIMKLAAAAGALAMLAGCAVTMPFPPLATSFPDSGDWHPICWAGSKCSIETSNSRVAYRRLKPANDGKIDDDPPDFIVNGGDQVDIKRQK